MSIRFSVIIPLYNKEEEIEGTIRSVLAQTVTPLEIVVVDDGSTDRSTEKVRAIDSPIVRLITQSNAGECAARNRGIAESQGEYIALLDADDSWEPQFLAEIASLIEEFPGCGLYATGFNIVRSEGRFPGLSPERRGIVADFFRESMTRYVATSSSSVVPSEIFRKEGYFPDGIRMGGDQFMWIKIARHWPVCFSPRRLANYNVAASNRSPGLYRTEDTPYSFRDLCEPGRFWQNEFIARVELGRALIISAKGGTEEAREIEQFHRHNRYSRRTWIKLRILNRLPASWRWPLLRLYNLIAWKVARKGL